MENVLKSRDFEVIIWVHEVESCLFLFHCIQLIVSNVEIKCTDRTCYYICIVFLKGDYLRNGRTDIVL